MSKRPLVLHIAPTPFFSDRGCHIRIEGISNGLAALGYDSLICTYHHGRDIQGINTSRISPIKNYTKTEAGPSRYKLWADWKLLCLTFKEIRRKNPEVIHAHLHEGLMIGLLAKIVFFRRRIPLVADMQGSLVGELEAHGTFNKFALFKWPIILIEKILLRFSKIIVCSSEHSLIKFKNELSIHPDRITLVQDGANPVDKLSSDERINLKKNYALPDTKTIVVYSGALLDSKGLVELKELINLSKSITSLHFLIIGYPTQNIESYLSENGLTNNCSLTGQIPFEQLPKLLQLADIAIDPKFSDSGEGSGKILNYLACGLPVLAFNTPNNQDFLPKGSRLANSSNEMAEQLSDLQKNPQSILEIGDLNLQHFLKLYSWQKSTEQLSSVYKKF